MNKNIKFSCFGSNPSYQTQAENDCCRCEYIDKCLKTEGETNEHSGNDKVVK